MSLPAVFQLLGKTLTDGWVVEETVGWSLTPEGTVKRANEGATGGNFSACYLVKRNSQTAFLKAIDLSRALDPGIPDFVAELKKIVDTATFEKELCELCGERRMDKVVLALGAGDITIGSNLQDRVPYIIFELADGDVRRRIQRVASDARLAWIFRAAHNAAVGLTQLHSAKVAHQDVKPSNVLRFEDDNSFKLGDMGRAIREGVAVPHSEYAIAGDPHYAPPELLYGHFDPDWRRRRLGCDLFMFGSLLAFFFLGQGITSMMMAKIEPTFHWSKWAGTYTDALPAIRRAFSDALSDLSNTAPQEFREELVQFVRELCEPDLSLRGHPRNRSQNQNQFDLSRYIARFDALAAKAEIAARRGAA